MTKHECRMTKETRMTQSRKSERSRFRHCDFVIPSCFVIWHRNFLTEPQGFSRRYRGRQTISHLKPFANLDALIKVLRFQG